MKSVFVLAFASMMWTAGTSLAQTCTEACSATRCDSRNSCQAAYQTCLENAAGDPTAEAACVQQRDACLASADNAYFSCANGCTSDACVANAQQAFGMDYTRCNDQYTACLETGGNPTSCANARDACVAQAGQTRNTRLLNCASNCTLPVAPSTWGNLKKRYRN